MLKNQAFISLFSYYLSLLRGGAVLEVHYSTQTFAERWVYDPEEDLYCVWDGDIRRISSRLDTQEFFRRAYEKHDSLRELLVFREEQAA